MNSRFVFIATASLFLFLSSAARAGALPVTMETFDSIAITTLSGAPVQSDQVKQAILAAAQKRKWIAQEIAPNAIVASILVRGEHQVIVDIVYTDQEFSVKYKGSENLDYVMTKRGPKIHRNYNKWVKNLVFAIRGEILPLR